MAYTSKIISLEAALALVKSGDTIVTGLGAAEAGLFMENIHTIADRVKDVKIVNCNPTHQCSFYAPEYVDSFRVDGWFYATPMRKAHEQHGLYPQQPALRRYQVALSQQAQHIRRLRLHAG